LGLIRRVAGRDETRVLENNADDHPRRNETTYPMTVTLIPRDPAKNTNLDNVELRGKTPR